MIIGLTGGIASGKSTVANMIKELRIPIIDADVIARNVVIPGEKAYEDIVKHFGKQILNSDGEINRKQLGTIVFNNEKDRLQLNKIVHPEIRKKIAEEISLLNKRGENHIVLDIPLLFETDFSLMVDKIVTVYVEEGLQLQRLKQRDSFSTEEALARIESQIPLHEKTKKSDAVIYNQGTLEETKEQLITIFKKWNCL